MFHSKRVWQQPHHVGSIDDLAEKLTQHTWTLCTAFEHREYFYLNDATSEDGALEYAIVKRAGDGYVQTESITFGWCTQEKAAEHIARISDGKLDTTHNPVEPRFDTSPHHHCHHCV